MAKEIFDEHITMSLRRLEELWRRADQLPKPLGKFCQQAEEFPVQQQELLMESLNELSNSLQELQVVTEELRQQNQQLIGSRMVVEAERQRYQELFNSALDGHLVTTKEAGILEANWTAAKLLNVSQERLRQKALTVFIAAGERQLFYSKLRQLQKGESIKNWQLLIQRRRGACIPVSCTVVPVQDSEGEVIGLRWRLQEIMPNRNAKPNQQSDRDENLFRAMFDNAAMGIVLLDNGGRVLKSNRALQEMLGCTSEALLTVFPDLMNLNKAGVESVLFQKLMAGEHHSYQLEKRFIAQNHSIRWGRLTVSLVQAADNESTFATCMLEDITNSRQVEAAQRQVIESLEARLAQPEDARQQPVEISDKPLTMPVEPPAHLLKDILSRPVDYFCLCDRTGNYIYVNRAAVQALGWAEEDLIGKTWQQLELPTEIKGQFDAQQNAVFITGQPVTDEAKLLTEEGDRNYEYRMTPISESNSDSEAVVVTVKDITDHKRSLAATSDALAKEAKLSAFQSNFASIVSHELRTSLNSIFCCAKLLESQTQEWTYEKKLKYLQRIQSNVKRSNQLLDDLFVIGLVGAGKLQLKPSLFDLTEFCRDLTEEMQQSMGSLHRLTFISQSQRSSACMDVKLLRQILTNLLLDAIKHSPQGDEIQFTLVCDGEQAIFRIQNLSLSSLQKDQELPLTAFQGGSQLGATPGRALGVSLVKQCVDLQRGEIVVKHEEGVGTMFTVTLPLNQRQLRGART